MTKNEMLELINEVDSMTPAAPFPCRTEKEIATIRRINEIWHRLFDKAYAALKELELEGNHIDHANAFNTLVPVSRAWSKFVKDQKRLARKQNDLIAYNAQLANVSIKKFHKNSMVELGTLSYPKTKE